MVFTGRYNAACHLCRKRKVKCDETKPNCKRCLGYGTPCPGYPPAYVFRDETGGVVERGRAAGVIQHRSRTCTPSRVASPPLPKPLLPGLEQIALGFFSSQYILSDANDSRLGHLGYLPALYGRDKCLDSATLAVSYLAAYNEFHDEKFWAKSREHYGLCLTRLQTAVSFPDTGVKEETFVAMLLLSMFVQITAEETKNANLHAMGLYHMLRLKGKEQLSRKNGPSIMLWAAPALIRCLLAEPQPFDNLTELMDLVDDFGLVRPLMQNCFKMADLCYSETKLIARLSLELEDDHAGYLMLGDWIDTACELLAELDQFDLGPVTELGQGMVSSYILIHTIHTSFSMKIVHCLKSIARMGIAETLFHEVPQMAMLATIRDRVAATLSTICAHVPYALGDIGGGATTNLTRLRYSVGAYQLLWPMAVLYHCELSSPEHIACGGEALRWIGSQFGIKLAHVLMEHSELLPPYIVSTGSAGFDR